MRLRKTGEAELRVNALAAFEQRKLATIVLTKLATIV
jgi:hypothetical protein